jgi:hypothetical protein
LRGSHAKSSRIGRAHVGKAKVAHGQNERERESRSAQGVSQ